MATTLMVIPMFAPYNQVLLLPVAMLITSKIDDLWSGSALTRFLTAAAALSVLWPWVGAGSLVIALLFLPGAVVQRAWAVPLFTTLAIPVTLFALLLVAGSPLKLTEDSK